MDANKQLADDVHCLTAPLRLVFGILRAAVFLAILPLAILGLCSHAAMVGGPIMDDDLWFLSKALFCVLAPFAVTLLYGCFFAKGGLCVLWAKEFLVLILSFAVVAGLLWCRAIAFDENDHAPAIWTNPEYDYDDVYAGGSAFKIGSMEKREVRAVLRRNPAPAQRLSPHERRHTQRVVREGIRLHEEQRCAGGVEGAALRQGSSEGEMMEFVHAFVLKSLVLDKDGDVQCRNVAVSFDLFEAEDHRNKSVENGYDTFVVPCDWRDNAAQSELVIAMREFREMVRRMQEEALR